MFFHRWPLAPPMAMGGFLFLMCSKKIENVHWLLFLIVLILVFLFRFLSFFSKFLQKTLLRSFLDLSLMVCLGFLLIGFSYTQFKTSKMRHGLGLKPENVVSISCTLISDAHRLSANSWYAESRLHQVSSGALTVFTRGYVTIIGSGSPGSMGTGLQIESQGQMQWNDRGDLLFFSNNSISQGWTHVFFEKRHHVLSIFMNNLMRSSKDTATFLIALVLGQRIDIGSPVMRAFRNVGSMHLLALSGFHVGLIAVAVRRITQNVFGKKGSIIISFLMVLIYMFFVGPRPSLVRSIMMYALWSWNSLRKHFSHPIEILAWTFILHSILMPNSIESLSFQLSYLALAGILLVGIPLSDLFKQRMPIILATLLGVGLGAQLMTLPLIINIFEIWRPIALIAAPLLTPFVIFSMLAGSLLTFFPDGFISTLLVSILDGSLSFVTILVQNLSKIPGVRMSMALAWIFVLIGIILACIRRRTRIVAEPRLPSLDPTFS